MQSLVLLVAVGVLMAVPGIAAVLIAYKPGTVGIVTRSAGTFGAGFAVAGGCAFVLAAAHIFWTYTYFPLWFVVTAGLWVAAIRSVSFRAQLQAVREELGQYTVPLALGGVLLLAVLVLRMLYIHQLPGAHYVYYLNGLQIANDHGVPSRVLEYGQAWRPATDKIFLDSFTAVLVLIDNNSVVGPGVLLWFACLGTALGAWAFAWELGLRWVSAGLMVLLIANPHHLGSDISGLFTAYRAQDFGTAAAFCALPLGVYAIRKGGLGPAVIAAVALAAASGSHLVPVVIVVIILGSVFVTELVRRARTRPRMDTLRATATFGGATLVLGLLIRLFAGGAFGLGGASNQSSYSVIKTAFDPTAYLYSGAHLTRHPHESAHFFIAPGYVLRDVVQDALNLGHSPPLGVAIGVLVVILAVGLAFTFSKSELADVGLAGIAVVFGIALIALFFSYRYHVWVDATFGTRRPVVYLSIGTLVLILGLVEAGVLAARRSDWKLAATAAPWVVVAAAVGLSVWCMPATNPGKNTIKITDGQVAFASWVRTHTPCGSRFLLNQRSEGTVAALTGRFALDEGMGAFLRPGDLSHVITLLLHTSNFFTHPAAHEATLTSDDINYVVVSPVGYTLGYPGPINVGSYRKTQSAPFLKLVDKTKWYRIYHVTGSKLAPVQPLLKGPYLQCRKTAVSY